MTLRIPGITVLLLLANVCLAQSAVPGEVTFLTAQHVYVKFEHTAGIAIKDTLEVLKDGVAKPCLVVSSMSSTSCVCTVVGGCDVRKQDVVRTRSLHTEEAVAPKKRRSVAKNGREVAQEEDTLGSRGERIRGRISAASYSMIPSERENDHRLMYRLSVDADHIADSKFSAETYLNYRRLYPADIERRPQRTEFFNVYNLAVSYDPDTNTTISLGRKINNSAASLGAIDGLQAERRYGRFYAGGILGFRPDIFTYDLNLDLLQYGGYLGLQLKNADVTSKTTLGLLQQTNRGMVDRRYGYFQHTSTFGGNLNIFSSCEVDLYSTVGPGARLTNLFLSARYKFSKKFDAFVSYDSRRRVVYYETFRSDVEVLLDDDDARQGARLRLNVRPMKSVSAGVALSKRFQADGANASDNVSGYLTYNKDPEGLGRWSVQVNRNTSSYVRSDILAFRHTRTLIPKHLNLNLYYRVVEYYYADRPEGASLSSQVSQRYYGADLSLAFAGSLTFTVLGEMSTVVEERNYRMNMSLIKRFDTKKRR